MWWHRTWCWAALAATLAVGGCGFHPLYGRHDDVALNDALSRVEIGPIRDRIGQQVRNALLDSITPSGLSGEPLYRLNVTLNESITSLAVQKTSDATRADLRLTASFQLTSLRTGGSVMSNDSFAISSFNILNSEFATLMEENNARARAVQELADEIRLKVSVFLRKYQQRTLGK